MNSKLLVFCVLVAVISGAYAADKKLAKAAPRLDTAGIGLYARIDSITKDGFTSTQYRAGDLSVYTWKSGHIVVKGVEPSNLVNGEYWHGRVEDQGVEKDPPSGLQRRVYKAVFEFKH